MPWRSPISYTGPKQLLLVFALSVLGGVSFATKVISQDVGKPISAGLQSFLPELRLKQTLTAPNELRGLPGLYQTQSGNSSLTISPDGERLAAYIRYGAEIETWSSNSNYQKAFPRYTSFGLDAYGLRFLDGHRLLISSPAADTNDAEGWKKSRRRRFFRTRC